MARRMFTRRLKSALACSLRLVVVFTLAFSTTLGAQAAFAESQGDGGSVVAEEGGSGSDTTGETTPPGASESGSSTDPKPNPEPEPESQPTPPPAPAHYIENFGIYLQEDENRAVTNTEVPGNVKRLSSARAGKVGEDPTLAITKRGEHIKLGVVVDWSDTGAECDPGYITFSLDAASTELASIETLDKKTGLLTAEGGRNGTVIVTATLDAAYTESGTPMESQVAVVLTGQDLAPYVTSIMICDDQGKPIGRGAENESYTFPADKTVKDAEIELQATVDVHDPATNADSTYQVTRTSGLSQQTGGLVADLTWTTLYDERGTVTPDGWYRALVEGDNIVTAKSSAGKDGEVVSNDAMVMLEGNGHPQEKLLLDAVWEADESKTVYSHEFSVADIEKIGTSTRSYTVYGTFGSSSFVTYTGRGVLLVDLLKEAKLDDKWGSIRAIRLDCYDTKGYEISWDLLVGKNRYYLPNADANGSEAGAVQVAPMLAVESARSPEGSARAVSADKLTNDDCFRLLFGVGIGDQGQNTRMQQRRWVNAIHVIFKGAEPTKDGDKGNGPDEEKDDTIESSGGQSSSGNGDGSAGGQGADGGVAKSGAGGQDGAGDAGEGFAGMGTEVRLKHNSGAWSILQAVNKNDSDVDALEFDNPFRPYTAPVCVGLFAAGGVEAFVRFRWQKRIPEEFPSEEG